MGSSSNPNPWAPYDSFKDCTLGICSIYCPQYCYIVFPPPPPSTSDDSSSGTYFSPLVIAVIGILASAFLLVTYYLLVTRYCRRRQGHRDDRILGSDQSGNTIRDQINQNESAPTTTTGLDEALIKTITVYKYRKGEGLVDGTDCSVCLSEFEENESLRLMPKCSHAFHLPCIDTWLKSHPSCPLCRSNVATIGAAAAPQQAPAAPRMPTSVTVTTAHAYRHRTDTVLVICDESRSDEATVIDINVNDGGVSSPKRMRRSASVNSVLWQSGGSSSSDRPVQSDQENLQFPMAIGDDDRSSNVPEMKRSISTGRFVSGRYGKGRNSIYPR